MSQFQSMKAKRLLRILTSDPLNYRITRANPDRTLPPSRQPTDTDMGVPMTDVPSHLARCDAFLSTT